MRGAGLLLLLALVPLACSRTWYREDADQEVYAALAEKLNDPRWQLPRVDVEPSPQSRFFDPTDPDRPPMPPDDPAAHQFMLEVDGHRGWPKWTRNGMIATVENPEWRLHLPLNAEGKLKLTAEGAALLAQINSRRFQTQLEDVYLVALAMTLDRFEFALQWFGGNSTFYEHFGTSSVPTETNTLTNNSRLGFTRNFAAGGQLLVDLANGFTWEYTGGTSSVSTNFQAAFLQPLLRNAGRQVRLEGLTQAERSLLYAIRQFARFRKEFYVEIAVDQYLALLEEVQRIRNQESNLKNLELTFQVQEALARAGVASSVQEDQAFTSFQQAKISLQLAKTAFENRLDSYKLSLGLPTDLPLELDDAALKPFQLISPELQAHSEAITTFINRVSQRDAPQGLDDQRREYEELARLRDTSAKFHAEVSEEVQRLCTRERDLTKEGKGNDKVRQTAERLAAQMKEVGAELDRFRLMLAQQVGQLRADQAVQNQSDLWIRGRDLSNQVGQIFVAQTQARVYLLELPRFEIDEQEAIRFAINERLDLMNTRAAVVDAWRQIEIAANALRGFLNLSGSANLATPFDNDTPFNFSALASRYRVGLEWDGPLNRQAERNNYRQALINYQRARRAYMEAEDEIVRTIRLEVRQLETDRLNFEMNRQTLIAAARQVEESQLRILVADKSSGPTDTLYNLQALDRLLESQNALIRQWLSYERGRIRLLLDMEQLQLDDDGVYRDGSATNQRQPAGERLPAPRAASQ